MEQTQAKATQFVTRLLANPAIKAIGPLAKEEQIRQFLKLNADQLYPTLSSQAFFPGMSWQQINAILGRALQELVNRSLESLVGKIAEQIDFSFAALLAAGGPQAANLGAVLTDLQAKLLEKPDARRALNGPLAAVMFNLTDRYVDQAFARREYIHFELTKVQKLRMGKEEIKSLLKVSLLLRNGIHYLGSETNGSAEPSGVVQAEFANKVTQILAQQLRGVPVPLLQSAMNSNISFLDNPKMETTARMASIFAVRSHNYRPMTKVDRGADTPDKSWFSIARRNYRFYGFDVKMLDELYKISGENGW
jgi:hypothetical protein